MSRESRESRERIRHCNPNFAEISVKMRWFVTVRLLRMGRQAKINRESQETYLDVFASILYGPRD
jgi:hypothetical protein